MTTATIISELLPFHDDALLADIEHIFDELDRTVEPTPPGEAFVILLMVEELVDELLAPVTPDELTIEIAIDLTSPDTYAEVAEVA